MSAPARETILARLRGALEDAQGSSLEGFTSRGESRARPDRATPTDPEPSPSEIGPSRGPLGLPVAEVHGSKGAIDARAEAVFSSEGAIEPLPAGADDREALARRFSARLRSLEGACDVVASPAAARERLAELVDGGGPHVLSWAPDRLPLPRVDETLRRRGLGLLVPEDLREPSWRSRAAGAEVGITGVEAAFAATGSLLLAAGAGRARVASLLPSRHIALVPSDRLFATFEDWLARARRDGRLPDLMRESGQLVFITGPSRSADIEQNLTLGVHGPRMVHAIVFPRS